MEADPKNVDLLGGPPAEVPGASGLSSDLATIETIRRKYLAREATIQSIGLLYLPWALVMTLVAFTAVGGATSRLFSSEFSVRSATELVATTGFFLGLAVAVWSIAMGVRRLQPTARVWAILLSVLGMAAFPVGTIVHGGIICILAGGTAKYIFSTDYKNVIAATPHIRYKISILNCLIVAMAVVVVLLAVLVLLR